MFKQTYQGTCDGIFINVRKDEAILSRLDDPGTSDLVTAWGVLPPAKKHLPTKALNMSLFAFHGYIKR